MLLRTRRRVWPWNRLTDREYIERIRKQVAWSDRARPWLIAFYIVLGAGFAFLLQKSVAMLFNIQPAWPGFLGFVMGSIAGFLVGFAALKIGHGLGQALFGLRTERLLLRCYDAIQAASESHVDVAEDAPQPSGEIVPEAPIR